MTGKETDPSASDRVDLDKARTYVGRLGDKEDVELALPSLSQLRLGFEGGYIISMGPEWTNEGFIYDPDKNSVDQEPGEGAVACFRLVLNQ